MRFVAGVSGERPIGPHKCLKLDLEILGIGCGVLVLNNQIDRELLEPPIVLRAQELADEFQIVLFGHPQQQDGQVARYPLRPKRRCPPCPTRQHVGGRAQRCVGID
jgi:hypothetical protein